MDGRWANVRRRDSLVYGLFGLGLGGALGQPVFFGTGAGALAGAVCAGTALSSLSVLTVLITGPDESSFTATRFRFNVGCELPSSPGIGSLGAVCLVITVGPLF